MKEQLFHNYGFVMLALRFGNDKTVIRHSGGVHFAPV
jgi:hypothetical protein